jgi:hypothetical protein
MSRPALGSLSLLSDCIAHFFSRCKADRRLTRSATVQNGCSYAYMSYGMHRDCFICTFTVTITYIFKVINIGCSWLFSFSVSVIVLAKYCNKWTRVAVVRVRHGAHRLVASCLPLLQQVDQHSVTVRTLYTGATLRQCYKFIQVICASHFCVCLNIRQPTS